MSLHPFLILPAKKFFERGAGKIFFSKKFSPRNSFLMNIDELLLYYHDLTRFAHTKCTSDADAEDLVSDTFVAALTFLSRGGDIAYPKTWLFNTFLHKYNAALRKKYGAPDIVTCDTLADIPCGDRPVEEVCTDETDEEAELRREVAYLASVTRETVLRYYFAGESVAQIANSTGVSEGTVKSRLFAGRGQIRKGLNTMTNQDNRNNLPSKLHLSASGSQGRHLEPYSLTANNPLAQNILVAAYEKPLSPVDIARKLGVPTAYIEPVLEQLTDGELMQTTDGGRYYTDLILYTPEDLLSRYAMQQTFVDTHFDRFWQPLALLLEKTAAQDFYNILNPRQQKKLEQYALLYVLQHFTYESMANFCGTPYGSQPMRKDGGQWIAQATVFPPIFDETKLEDYIYCTIRGGHRTTAKDEEYLGSKGLALFEFDTRFKDCTEKAACGWETYMESMRKLLWCVRQNIPLDTPEANLPSTLIESIPIFTEGGILARENGALTVDIPTIYYKDHWNVLMPLINEAKNALLADLTDDFVKFLRGTAVPLPEHLRNSPNVPEYLRYECSHLCIEMAVIRKAHERGLHLHDVDYPCPPMLLLYVE